MRRRRCTYHCNRAGWIKGGRAKARGLRLLPQPEIPKYKAIPKWCKKWWLFWAPAVIIRVWRFECRVMALSLWAFRRFYRRLWFGVSAPSRWIDRMIKRWIDLYKNKKAFLAALDQLLEFNCSGCGEKAANSVIIGTGSKRCELICMSVAEAFQEAKIAYWTLRYRLPEGQLKCKGYCRRLFGQVQSSRLQQFNIYKELGY